MITLIHPNIDPVILSFGQMSIRWYGLSYVIGFIVGIILIKKINEYFINSIKTKDIDDFFIWAALGVIIGGRLGYITFYQTYYLTQEPLHIFYIWKGGMSFHGGLIGITISTLIFSYYKKLSFFLLTDLISTVAPIGIFFGRVANFINVELYGRATTFPFAMVYPTIDNERRHPSQLYEAFSEGLIIFLILILITRKTILKNRIGINTSLFLIMYGFFRIIVEYTREPDSHIGYILQYFTMGQLLSVPIIILGFFILFFKKKNE